jgi:hypothetical protein
MLKREVAQCKMWCECCCAGSALGLCSTWSVNTTFTEVVDTHIMPGRRTAMKLRHNVLTRTLYPVAKFRTKRLFSSNDRLLGEWVRDAEKGSQWTIQTPGWRSESIVDDVAEHPGPNARRVAAAKHVGHSNKGVLNDQHQNYHYLHRVKGLRPHDCARRVDPVSGSCYSIPVIISICQRRSKTR